MINELIHNLPSLLVACGCAAVVWLGPAYAAWRLATRWFADESLSRRWLVAAIVNLAFVIVLMQALGGTGYLARGPVVAACILFAIAAFRVRTQRNLTDDLHEGMDVLRRLLSSGYGILFCLAAVLVFQVVMRGLRCPPLAWDSLTYHAFLPARWLQLSGFALFPDPGAMETYQAFPKNMEYLVALALLPFHHDLFINLVNLPVIAVSGLAGYVLARELGAKRAIAAWVPFIFTFSPAAWSLVTTQYVDVLVAGMQVAGLVFLVRYLRTGHGRDAWVCAAALGLAAGTKYTGLVATIVACPVLVAALTFAVGRRQRMAQHLLLGLAIGFAAGGTTYLRNAVQLGNPVYPFEIAPGGVLLFEGSPRYENIVPDISRGSRAEDWEVVEKIFSSGSMHWGWKYVPLLGLCVAGSIWPHRHRRDVALVTIAAAVALLMFFGPQDHAFGWVRRKVADSTMRMLGFPMLAIAAGGVAMCARWRWPRGLVAIVPTFLVAADAWFGQYRQPPSNAEIVAVISGTLITLWLLSARRVDRLMDAWEQRRFLQASSAAALLLVAAMTAGVLQHRRDAARYYHYASSTDYHDIPRELVGGWQACDEPGTSHVIAFTRHRGTPGEDVIAYQRTLWFYYPLMGSQLQNRVVYAPVSAPTEIPGRRWYDDPLLDAPDRRADLDTWMTNLAEARVDRVFVVDGAEPESTWIAEKPETFSLVHQEPACRVYEVNHSQWAQHHGEDRHESDRPS